ncbi:MAG TPA: UvrD-helicase domain-containing protein, partial [Thermogutta sp.]|nr:UvrD-helicase domain-containing protein [Thermogutta sp.]
MGNTQTLASSQPKNVVIRASAGAGKTFQLTNRFLWLLARGERLDSILATTFSREAAGEILDRIL